MLSEIFPKQETGVRETARTEKSSQKQLERDRIVRFRFETQVIPKVETKLMMANNQKCIFMESNLSSKRNAIKTRTRRECSASFSQDRVTPTDGKGRLVSEWRECSAVSSEIRLRTVMCVPVDGQFVLIFRAMLTETE